MYKLTDTDQMPFGKYKGIPMQDVPASYLHWLWTQDGFDKNSQIGVYITENLAGLKQEYKDGIWS
jgi:uncharacterized protein (DUF3820 family)